MHNIIILVVVDIEAQTFASGCLVDDRGRLVYHVLKLAPKADFLRRWLVAIVVCVQAVVDRLAVLEVLVVSADVSADVLVAAKRAFEVQAPEHAHDLATIPVVGVRLDEHDDEEALGAERLVDKSVNVVVDRIVADRRPLDHLAYNALAIRVRKQPRYGAAQVDHEKGQKPNPENNER